jgi:hypothetical protein
MPQEYATSRRLRRTRLPNLDPRHRMAAGWIEPVVTASQSSNAMRIDVL